VYFKILEDQTSHVLIQFDFKYVSGYITLRLCAKNSSAMTDATRSFYDQPILYRRSKLIAGTDVSLAHAHSRSQWPHGLRLKMSLPAQTLRSWVQIPLEVWMSVCFYFVCVVLCK
jgi:hypothetical protein